jgi:hypothetical protein
LAVRVVWVGRKEIIPNVAVNFTDMIVVSWGFKWRRWVPAHVDFFEGTLGAVISVDIVIVQ